MEQDNTKLNKNTKEIFEFMFSQLDTADKEVFIQKMLCFCHTAGSITAIRASSQLMALCIDAFVDGYTINLVRKTKAAVLQDIEEKRLKDGPSRN